MLVKLISNGSLKLIIFEPDNDNFRAYPVQPSVSVGTNNDIFDELVCRNVIKEGTLPENSRCSQESLQEYMEVNNYKPYE